MLLDNTHLLTPTTQNYLAHLQIICIGIGITFRPCHSYGCTLSCKFSKCFLSFVIQASDFFS